VLTVGEVRTKVGFIFDRSDADKFERKESELRRKSRDPIRQKVGVDADTRGIDRYERRVNDVDKAHGNLARGSGRVRTALGSLWIGGAGVAAGAVAFAGLAKEVGSATSAFQESQAIARQTHAVLKSTGGAANVTAKDVQDLATAISKKTGIDDEQVRSSENMLLTFTNVRNEVGKGNDVFTQATHVVTDMSVALGQDGKSSAIQLGKALNDPIKGITALQRVGVTFTKQQKDQIASLVQHGKTVEAQKLILRELNKEFGGSAKAQNNWSKQLSVTWGNLQETIGGKLAPALQAAGGWLNKFLNGLMAGNGQGGRFLRVIRDVAGGVRGVFAGAFSFVNRILTDNRKTIDSVGRTFGRLWADARRYFGGIRSAISSVFGSGSGTGRDIRQIISSLLSFISVVLKVFEAVVRRALPGIITAFRGLALIVRGVIKVIAGLLHGDFSKAWDGVKDIFSGGVKLVGGILRAGTAPIRAAAAALAGVVVKAIDGLPGALSSIGKRAVSALGRALSGIPGAIIGAFKGGGSFLGGIGQGIADWLNAHTPFGDSIKVGPLHVRLPALRRGGKAGPGKGGPAVVYGEGAKDEWWISQEGDKRKNIGWAVEALQSLTGKGVAFFRSGGKKGGSRKAAPKIKPVIPTARHDAQKRSVRGTEAGIKDFERDIQRMERKYDQEDRRYGQSEEILVVENDDGTTYIDKDAIGQRAGELNSLHAMRQKIKDKYEDYKSKVQAAISVYSAAIARLTKAIKAASGSKRQKERSGYLAERQSYSERVGELRDLAKDLDLDIGDQDLDLGDIEVERASVLGTKAPAPPADSSSSVAAGDTGGSSDSGPSVDSGSADTTAAAAAPSPLDIAAAALADFANFNSARQSLFSNMGDNYMSREGLAALLMGTAPATMQAAGLRAFGAMPAEGTTVNITNNFGGGPTSPQTWAQQQQFAVESALG
jgi:hypothetical protein